MDERVYLNLLLFQAVEKILSKRLEAINDAKNREYKNSFDTFASLDRGFKGYRTLDSWILTIIEFEADTISIDVGSTRNCVWPSRNFVVRMMRSTRRGLARVENMPIFVTCRFTLKIRVARTRRRWHGIFRICRWKGPVLRVIRDYWLSWLLRRLEPAKCISRKVMPFLKSGWNYSRNLYNRCNCFLILYYFSKFFFFFLSTRAKWLITIDSRRTRNLSRTCDSFVVKIRG